MYDNRTFHPSSWSEQARRLGDSLFDSYKKGIKREKDINNFFTYRYYHFVCQNIIEEYKIDIRDFRAAKRVGRLIRKYNKKNGGI